MAVQVSYPGVYVDEFAPGAPIEGVGTNTAVFLGIAEKGPRDEAVLITSWDGFVDTFGGFVANPNGWLAKGVFGFFANGGTRCYVRRVSSAATARADLLTRVTDGGNALSVTANAEGPAGNRVAVSVTDTSRSDTAVAAAMTRTITAVAADLTTLTVAGGVADLGPDTVLTVSRGETSVTGAVQSATGDTVVLKTALPNPPTFVGGTLRGDFTVRVLVAGANVTATSPGRDQLTLDAVGHRLAVGDAVQVAGAPGGPVDAFVTDVAGAVVTITPALPTGFTAASVRTADLAAGTRRLRLLTPAALGVAAAFPVGSLVAVGPQFARVTGSGGDAIVLDTTGLASAIALTDQASAPVVATADFDLSVLDPANPNAERFAFLSMDPRSRDYWGTAVTSGAVSLALADPLGSLSPSGDDRPATGSRSTAGGAADNPDESWDDLLTTPAQYLDPLARLKDVALVAVPGGSGDALQQALIAHCESLQDRFAVLDCAPGLDLTGIETQFASVRSAKGYAALYYPWIVVRHPVTGALEQWPPSGHLTGVYARTDAERGVHKAPANTTIRGALGLERALSDTEQGPLNLEGINVLRTFPGQSQPLVWGARTTAGNLDRNWQYVNVRRLFIYLEQSIEVGIRWAVFEPNDLALWQKLKRSIGDFLTQVWRDGALFGAKAEDAFYVRIDEVLNPPSTRALGRLYVEVGVQPTYPAEFIVLRIGIWNGGADVTTS